MKNLRFFLLTACLAIASLTFAQTKADPLTSLRSPGISAKQLLGANGSGDLAYFGANDIVSGGSGISVSASGVIANTAPDQPVTITGSGRANVTGTYPNFNVTVPNEVDGSITNETITTFARSGSNLRITEAGTNYDLAMSTLISSNAGNALSLVSGQLFVTQSAAVASQRKPYVTSSAIAPNGTFATTGLTLPSSTNNFYVYVDGFMMDAKENTSDSDWDYDRTGTSQLTFKRAVSSGSKILIVY